MGEEGVSPGGRASPGGPAASTGPSKRANCPGLEMSYWESQSLNSESEFVNVLNQVEVRKLVLRKHKRNEMLIKMKTDKS